jgi:hypothetical protein
MTVIANLMMVYAPFMNDGFRTAAFPAHWWPLVIVGLPAEFFVPELEKLARRVFKKGHTESLQPTVTRLCCAKCSIQPVAWLESDGVVRVASLGRQSCPGTRANCSAPEGASNPTAKIPGAQIVDSPKTHKGRSAQPAVTARTNPQA